MFEDSAIVNVLAVVVVRVDAKILFFDRYIFSKQEKKIQQRFQKKYDVGTDSIKRQNSDEIICVGLSQNMWIIRDVMTAKPGVHVDKKGRLAL